MQRLTVLFWTTLIYLSYLRLTEETRQLFHRDWRETEQKKFLVVLTEELLLDSKAKQRQTQGIREVHSFHQSYEIGLVIGKLREKYKRMIEIYKEAYHMKALVTSAWHWVWYPWHWKWLHTRPLPPKHPSAQSYSINDKKNRFYGEYKTLDWVERMEIMRTFEVDIDKHINMLETMGQISRETSAEGQGGLRAGKEIEEQDKEETSSVKPIPRVLEGVTFDNEEQLKQYYRDKYEENQGYDKNFTLDEYYGFT